MAKMAILAIYFGHLSQKKDGLLPVFWHIFNRPIDWPIRDKTCFREDSLFRERCEMRRY